MAQVQANSIAQAPPRVSAFSYRPNLRWNESPPSDIHDAQMYSKHEGCVVETYSLPFGSAVIQTFAGSTLGLYTRTVYSTPQVRLDEVVSSQRNPLGPLRSVESIRLKLPSPLDGGPLYPPPARCGFADWALQLLPHLLRGRPSLSLRFSQQRPAASLVKQARDRLLLVTHCKKGASKRPQAVTTPPSALLHPSVSQNSNQYASAHPLTLLTYGADHPTNAHAGVSNLSLDYTTQELTLSSPPPRCRSTTFDAAHSPPNRPLPCFPAALSRLATTHTRVRLALQLLVVPWGRYSANLPAWERITPAFALLVSSVQLPHPCSSQTPEERRTYVGGERVQSDGVYHSSVDYGRTLGHPSCRAAGAGGTPLRQDCVKCELLDDHPIPLLERAASESEPRPHSLPPSFAAILADLSRFSASSPPSSRLRYRSLSGCNFGYDGGYWGDSGLDGRKAYNRSCAKRFRRRAEPHAIDTLHSPGTHLCRSRLRVLDIHVGKELPVQTTN
ncbi:hypothetical protein C8F01DRAFT_1303096 [Mycena amicta]|nr:hypothetical protein C8F01DRAFT_1303096 [Mycena amicta]